MTDSTVWLSADLSNIVTLLLAAVTLSLLTWFINRQFFPPERWEKYGVKQANMGSLAFTDFRAGCHKLILEHGDTVGTYTGDHFLFTRDLSLLRMIMVKDFNKFTDRLELIQSNSPIHKGLFFIGGPDWKRIRQVMSPCFSTGKVKGFAKTINGSAQKLAAALENYAKRGQLAPIKHLTGQYTSEIIARLAFGLRTDCIGKEEDEFTHYAKNILKIHGTFMQAVMFFFFQFPKFHKFLVTKLGLSIFDNVSTEADTYFRSILHRTIAERQEYVRSGQEPLNDFLQSLVTAKEEGDKAIQSAASATAPGGADGKQQQMNAPKSLTYEELIGQAMLIIFAGFETTSTALQMCLYLLAKHPDIQERVYEEIQDVISSEIPTYDDLGKLKYLGRVVNESLRMFPPASIITRRALETCTYGNVTIPKGAAIMIPLDLIMKDPKHFPNPEVFDPDRFSEENVARRDPMAFIPFGYGPRLCIGMRLALLELKLGLVHLLRKTQFELNETTVPKPWEELQTKFQGLILVEKPVMLSVKLRERRPSW